MQAVTSLRAITSSGPSLRPSQCTVQVASCSPRCDKASAGRSDRWRRSNRASVQEAPGSTIVVESRQLPAPLQSSFEARAAQSVAELASAWSQVARRLPSAEDQDEALIIGALKLALSWSQGLPPRRDGRLPSTRAVQLAATLADLSAAGLPLDAEAIAAGIVLEAADSGYLDHHTIEDKLGTGVATLVHDILRVRTAPQRVELYDDAASSAIREWCLAFQDVRANAVEVICRWDELQHMAPALPLFEAQLLALEVLQVYAPLGHALGLGPVCAGMEDLCFKVLFPESYNHTNKWLCNVLDEAEDALFACQQQLLAALDDHPRFKELASSCVLRARTKSLFSIMKKLLRLGDMSSGGRQHEEIYDLLGMRAIVQPRTDLPPDEAEAAAREACFLIQHVAQSMWAPVCGRTKDYITQPKSNGYSSIHVTLCLAPACAAAAADLPCVPADVARSAIATASMSMDEEDDGGPMPMTASSAPYLELQIRTQAMDDRAEIGDAAHTAYKGGLDSRQARQLQAWTRELQQRLAGMQHAKLMLPVLRDSTADGDTPASHGGTLAATTNSVEALFRHMDKDNSGRITVDELREQLRDILPHRRRRQQQQQQLQHAGAGLFGDPFVTVGGGVSGGGFSSMSSYDEPDAEALLELLETVAEPAGVDSVAVAESLFSEEGGERGMTLPEFARFLKKVVLVNALSRVDKENIDALRVE